MAAPSPDTQQNGGGVAWPLRVAQLEERLAGLDRLYVAKFVALEERIDELSCQVKTQQKWIQGTAILVALEVLAIAVALSRWAL